MILPIELLMVLFIFFVALAFATRDAYVFSVAGIVSIIFGIEVGLLYTVDAANWAYGIIGFALIFFGFWLIIACIQYGISMKGGRK